MLVACRVTEVGTRDEKVTYSCQLENFGCEVLKHCCDIDGCLGADAHLVLGVVLEETLDTTARELWRLLLVMPSRLEL